MDGVSGWREIRCQHRYRQKILPGEDRIEARRDAPIKALEKCLHRACAPPKRYSPFAGQSPDVSLKTNFKNTPSKRVAGSDTKPAYV